MVESSIFENCELCTGTHCPDKQECARWICNVDYRSPKLKCAYAVFNTKQPPQFGCPYFLPAPHPDYPYGKIEEC